jgi:transposase
LSNILDLPNVTVVNYQTKELFPKATIVYDRFHVMDIINGELNELRKLIMKKVLPRLGIA